MKSSTTFDRSMAACAAQLVLAVVMALGVVPAWGQTEVDEGKISNLANSNDGWYSLYESRPKIGQRFRTGPHPSGYRLSRVFVRIEATRDMHNFDLSAGVYRADGRGFPIESEQVATLVRGSNLSHYADNRFFVPTSTMPVLLPNTDYIVLFSCPTDSSLPASKRCNGGDEWVQIARTVQDTYSPTQHGWSIASESVRSTNGTTFNTITSAIKISVHSGLNTGAAYIVENGVSIVSTPIATDSEDTYGHADAIRFAVEFAKEVLVNGTPSFRFTLGDEVKSARFEGGSGTRTLTFVYHVTDSDSDSDGIWIGDNYATLAHNPARAFRGSTGVNRWANAVLKHSPLNTQSGHRVDGSTSRPSISAIRVVSSPLQGDTYWNNEAVRVRVSFDAPVTVTDAPVLAVAVGNHQSYSQAVFFRYASGSGTADLDFTHTVQPDDVDADGFQILENALAPGGDLDDGVVGGDILAAGNGQVRARVRNAAKNAGSSHKVAGSRGPRITSAAVTSVPLVGDTYGRGEAIEWTLTVNESVTVAGSPTASMFLESDWKGLVYARGSGTDRLVFRYVVQSADSDPDGPELPYNALAEGGDVSTGLPDGTIRSVSRNADLFLNNGRVQASNRHKVDGSLRHHSDATLSSLALSGAELDPVFESDTISYDWTVPKEVPSSTVTAAATIAPGAIVTTLPVDADDMTEGHQLALDYGPNPVTVTVTAADGVTMKTYTVDAIRTPNMLPTSTDATLSTPEDTSHTFQASDFAFSDPDGDAPTGVRIATLPSRGMLTLNGTAVKSEDVIELAALGGLVFTPAADENGDPYMTFTFKVRDALGESASAYPMTIVVTAVEDAPRVATEIDDLTATVARPFSFVVPQDAFVDPDGDMLTYAATRNDGSVLPTWLAFAAATRTFSGTPQTADTGTVTVKVTASDGKGSVSDSFDLVVGTNSAPTASDATITALEDTVYAFEAADFNFADSDPSDILTSVRLVTLPDKGSLQLGNVALIAGGIVPVANLGGNLTYLPEPDEHGEDYTTFRFKVNDGLVETNSDYLMTVNVTPVNDAPTVTKALEDQTTVVRRPFAYTVPDNAFEDPEGAALHYAATQGDGSALPAWLTFAAPTRVFSGTPANADTGTVTVKVTASDGTGSGSLSVSDEFALAVVVIPKVTLALAPDTIAEQDDPATVMVDEALTTVTATIPGPAGVAFTIEVAAAPTAPATTGDYALSSNTTLSFAADATSSTGAVTVMAVDNDDHSPSRQVVVSGSVTGTAARAPDDVALTITEDEALPTLKFAVATLQVHEEDGQANLRAALSPASRQEITANYATEDGTAVDGTDFTASSGSLIFAAGETEKVITVPLVDDSVALEPVRTFSVRLSGTDAAKVTLGDPAVASVKIDDPIDQTVVSIEDAAVTEDVGMAETMVSMTEVAAVDVSVAYTTRDDTARAPDDYTSTIGTAMVPAGHKTVMISAPVVDDSINEPKERFEFRMARGPNLPPAVMMEDGLTGVVVITDNDDNSAPTSANLTVTTREDTSYTFQASDFSFSDPDEGQTLSGVRVVTLPGAGTVALDGTAVTANQVVTRADIDANRLTYSPSADANGNAYATFTFKVSDGLAESNSAYTLTVDVTPVADGPAVATALDDQTAVVGRPFSYVVPGDAFTDADGDALHYSATQGDGSALPGWLTFTASTRTFSGTSGSGDAGTITVKVTVKDGTDNTARSVADEFDVSVGTNSAPTASNLTVTTQEDTSYTFQAGDFNFSDPDTGDTLASVRIATLPGAGTVALDGTAVTANQVVTRADIDANRLTYSPSADANGNAYATFTFKVSDGLAESNSAYTLTVDVTPVVDGPAVATALDDQTAVVGRPFSYVVPGDAFTDVDGDALHYSATRGDGSALPGWLTFTASTRTFSGRPGSGDAGTIAVKVTVKDGTDNTARSVADEFDVSVGTNSAPTASNNTVTVDEDGSHTFAAGDFNFSDPDTGDTLASVRIATLPGAGTVALDGTAVTANQVVTRADIDANRLTYSPPADANGNAYATFTFKVSDGLAESDSAYTLTVDVTPVVDGPAVATALDDQTAVVGRPFSYVVPGDAFTDVDGDALHYSATRGDGSALPGWLTFTASTRTFSGRPGSGDAGTIAVKVTVKDGTDNTARSVADEFDVSVGTNSAPTASNNTVTVDEDGSHTFAAGDFNFSDPDAGDTLASVRIATLPGAGTVALDGTAVTANQVVTRADIDANRLTYSPSADANGNAYATFTFKVSDGLAESDSAYTLTVDVTPVVDGPAVATALDDQTAVVGRPFSYVVPGDAFTDVDGDALHYSATRGDGSALPGWLTFTASTRTFSGTPGSGDAGTIAVKVTVKDGTDNTARSVADEFDVSVGTNSAPTASNNTVTVDEDGSHTFAAGDFNFSDPDAGDTLASVRIATLPGAGTVALDGTAVTANQVVTRADIDANRLTYSPPADANGNAYATFTFKVSDGLAESDSAYTLTVDVTPVVDGPAVATALDDQTAVVGRPFSYVVPDDAFTDADGDALHYSATRGDGSALPGWLTFTASTRTFSGTPGSGDAGTITVKVTVKDGTDNTARSVADEFDVSVGTNSAPTASNLTVTTQEDTSYTFQASDFSFSDPDTGDTLASVRIATLPGAGTVALDGTAVTANQVVTRADIDANRLTYSPSADANGNAYATFTFKVSDGLAESNSAYTLTVDVTPVVDGPAVATALDDQTAVVGRPFSYVVPDDAFTDADGDALHYSATRGDGSALPGWLTFTASTRTFSGTPGSGDAGTITVKVTVKDGTDNTARSVADEFDVSVGTNSAPTASNLTVTTQEDTSYTFQASDFSFSDPDTGDTLASVRIATLPGAGTVALDGTAVTANQVVTRADIDANRLTYSPSADANGNAYATFTFKVSDGLAESNSAYTLTVDVTPVVDGPAVATALDDQVATINRPFSYEVPDDAFTAAEEGDALHYSATRGDGSALPGWLTFTASTRTFSGRPRSRDAGTMTINVTAADGNGGSASARFELIVIDQATAAAGVCSRTPQVRARIMTLLTHVHGHSGHCAAVTSAHLAKITHMELGSRNITALKSDDFAGLTSLREISLGNNRIEKLPSGVFDGLTRVRVIWLHENGLRSLPSGVFADLVSLQRLDLAQNSLRVIPYDELERLPALRTLHVYENPATSEITLQMGSSAVSVPRGGQSAYRVRLTQESNDGVTVEVASNQPWLTVEPRTLTFNRDDWFRSQEVRVSADASASGTATLSHAYSGAFHAYTAPPGVTIRVTRPRWWFLVSDTRVTEGPGASLAFTVRLNRVAQHTVTVDYATADGSATADSDYTPVNGTLTFAARETTKTVTVPILDDAHDEAEETLTLTLSRGVGASVLDAEATGTIENTDPLPQAWLARFGRTVAGHVMDAVEDRLRGPAEPHVTVGGYRLPWGAAAEETPQAPEAGGGWAGGLGAEELWPDSYAGTDQRLGQSRTITLREILLGSSFRLMLGDEDAQPGALRLTAWGRVAGTQFNGRDGTLDLGGDVLTGTLGVDGQGDRWLAGVLMSHSLGDGSFAMDGIGALGSGELDTALTSIHPYGRYTVNDRLDVWGVLGYGWGDLTLELGTDTTLETDMDLVMGAFGGRGVLLSAEETWGVEVATRTDAMFTRMTSEAVAGLESTEADAHRVRLILEGTRGFTWAAGQSLTPSVELGLRHDWGDAETGFGLELGGRVQYANPAWGLTIEGAARGLLAHEDSAYEELGAWGTIQVTPGADGQGLALTLAPTWGAASNGVESLWGRQDMAGLAPQEPTRTAGGRLEAEVGYGLVVPFGSDLVTPYVGLAAAEGERIYRLGGRWAGGTEVQASLGLASESGRTWRVGGRWIKRSGLQLSLEGQRQEPTGRQPMNQGVQFQATRSF